MIPLTLDDAITLVDYYNWKIRAFDRKSEKEIWAIANTSIQENGLEWCTLVLGYEKKQNELASKFNKNQIVSNEYYTERRRITDIFTEKEKESIANHKKSRRAIKTRNHEIQQFIKQVQTA